jgi:hypothetical protein
LTSHATISFSRTLLKKINCCCTYVIFWLDYFQTPVYDIFRAEVATELSTVTNTMKENCQLRCNPQAVSWIIGFRKCSSSKAM